MRRWSPPAAGSIDRTGRWVMKQPPGYLDQGPGSSSRAAAWASVGPPDVSRVSGPGEQDSRPLPLRDGSREDTEVETEVGQDSGRVERLDENAVRRARAGGHDDYPGR